MGNEKDENSSAAGVPAVLGFTPAEEAALTERDAGAAPTRVLEAFLPDELKAAGLELHPVHISSMLVLQKLDHPLYQIAKLAANGATAEQIAAVEFSTEDILAALYIFTQPSKRVRLEAQRGKAAFQERVMEELADKLPAQAMQPVAAAILAHFFRAHRTAPQGEGRGAAGPPRGDGGAPPDPSKPSRPPATASDGY